MKTIDYVLDDFTVGKKCFVEDLAFLEIENYYFSRESSFYRRYTLEVGLDVCILKIDLNENLLLKQLKSLNSLYYTQIVEISERNLKEYKLSHNDGSLPTSLELSSNQNLRSIWFSFTRRWLENKALLNESDTEKFSISNQDFCLPENQSCLVLFNEIFEIANKSPLNNFKLKLKLYAFLNQVILTF